MGKYPDPDRLQRGLFVLQQVVWESQMRLGQTQLPTVARLQLVKAQAIQQALFIEYSGLSGSDTIIMDAQLLNKFLSQDLTAQLSADPKAEEELICLYQFVASLLPATGAYDRCKTVEAKSDNPVVKAYAQQLLKADFMYRMCTDPKFTLYARLPTVGVPFFATDPNLLLSEKDSLKIVIGSAGDPNNPLKNGAIQSADGRNLANIYWKGHPDFAEDATRIREAKPFLPTIYSETADKQEMGPKVLDDRVSRSFPEWLHYVAEKSRSTALAIPPAALAKLFEIRQAPSDGCNGKSNTSYESSTAVRAMTFLTDPSNMPYLEHPFVQQFLSESLFGSFLMQQALMEYPELMSGLLDNLQARIEATKDRPEIQSYLIGVATQMRAHAQVRKDSWDKYGMISGLINGSLPVHTANKKGGILNRIEENFKGVEGIENREQINEPMGYCMQFVDSCVDKLDEILSNCADQKLRLHLFEGGKGERLIDKATTPEAREHLLQLLISEYQRDLSSGDLKVLGAQDFARLFSACQQVDQPDVQLWFHTTVLPLFSTLNNADKAEALTTFANEFTKPPLTQGQWSQNPDNPSLFRFQGPTKSMEIDLYNLAQDSGKVSPGQKTPIPPDLLMRADIQKALKTDRVVAQVLKEKDQITYLWSHEGQQFSLKTDGKGKTELTRTIQGVKYTFQSPPTDSEDSAAEALLARHGVWRYSADARIFTQGMQMPSRLSSYAERKVTGLSIFRALIQKGSEGHYVSSTPRSEHVSPLLFVSQADRVITLLTKDQIAELRLERSDLHFVREKDQWICMRGAQSLGKLEHPANEQPLIDAFGEHWTEFVIPLKKTDGSTSFILLPYEQSVNRHGVMGADQAKSTHLDRDAEYVF